MGKKKDRLVDAVVVVVGIVVIVVVVFIQIEITLFLHASFSTGIPRMG